MIVNKIRIKNFKPILDTGEVNLDPKITTLIGKNESGKTYTLKALESFNLNYKYKEEDLNLNSAERDKLRSGQINAEDIEIITIWFEIEKKDKKKLKEIDPKLTKLKTLKITKCFNNKYYVESPDIALENIEVTAKSSITIVLKEIKDIAKSFREALDNHTKRFTSFSVSKSQYNQIFDKIEKFDYPDTEYEVDDFEIWLNDLSNLPNQDAYIKIEIDTFSNKMIPYINELREILSKEEENIYDRIFEILPNFMYFSDVERLQDGSKVADFLANKEKYKTLGNLMEISDIDIASIKDDEDYYMLSKLKEASTTITGLVNESWTQEKVDVNIDFTKDKIIISITDDVTGKKQPPSERSQGFQWFLSFYINFTIGSKKELKNTIILLDDPGIYLHASGQKDLLKTLEELSKSNQIAFSTHSPFMVDRDKLERIRIVSKEVKRGTLIKEKFYVSEIDALEPIRASIGMTLGDALFTGKKNLFVEGYSDELILKAMSILCFHKGKNCIEESNITIFPTLGAEKMPFFTTLCEKENLDFLVLLDCDSEGKKVKNALIEKFVVDENVILTLDVILDNTSKGKDIEIEDLIDIDFYFKAFILAYKDILPNELSVGLDRNKININSVKDIKDFLKIRRKGKLEKIKVAKKVCNIIAEEESPSDETIENFSNLFKIINEHFKKPT